MVVGVRERMDSFGHVLAPLSRDEVLEKLQILVDRGAMGFVVACSGASRTRPTSR